MCLIAVAPKGTDKYSQLLLEGLEHSSIKNNDGIGFAYKKYTSGDIYFCKGIMSFKSFKGIYLSHKIDPKDEVVIHLRKGNKGTMDGRMTHPFKMSEALTTDMMQVGYHIAGMTKDPLLFHNGTLLDYYSSEKPLLSDTYRFAKEMMSVKEVKSFLKRSPKEFAFAFSHTLKDNKFAFMYPGDLSETILLGDFNKAEGYSFSNYSWENHLGVCTAKKNYTDPFHTFPEDDPYDWYNQGQYERDTYKQHTPVIPLTPVVLKEHILLEDTETNNTIVQTEPPVQEAVVLPMLVSTSLNEVNFEDFSLIARKGCSIIHPSLVEGRAYYMKSWNSSLINQKQSIVYNGTDKTTFYDVTPEQLTLFFNLVPKQALRARYAALHDLKASIGIPSKNLMKKLKPIMTIRLAFIRVSVVSCGDHIDSIDKYAVAYYYLQNLSILYDQDVKAMKEDIAEVKRCIAASKLLVSLISTKEPLLLTT